MTEGGDQRLADMVATLARGLVDTPDEVRVEREREGDTTVLSLYVAQEDLGQVIGRGGRIARSLRLVTRQAAHASGGRVNKEMR